MTLAFRIAGAPVKEDIIDRFGVDPTSAEAPTLQAILNFERVWKGKGSGRYSNGMWPVLYTAEDIDTAVVERGYWVFHGAAVKVRKDKVFPHVQYTMELSGICSSAFKPDGSYDPQFVHPSDYSFCHGFAETAIGGGVDYLRVPSARSGKGVCLPVLKETSARFVASGADIVAEPVVFCWYAGARVFRCKVDGRELDVTFEDVFGTL